MTFATKSGGLLSLLLLLSCGDESPTALRLTVEFDPSLALDQLRLVLSLGSSDPYLVPSTPAPLQSGRRVVLLLPDEWAGQTIAATVVGMAGTVERARGQTSAEVVRAQVVDRDVRLCGAGCTLGERQCTVDTVRVCEDFGNCLDWATEKCPAARPYCVANACSETCRDECATPGARRCSGSTGYQVCAKNGTNPCLTWGPITACASRQSCRPSDGQCECSSNCVPQVINNFVFVTSTSYSPLLGGLAGADAECNKRAVAAGVPGKYVAWLSTSAMNAKNRLGTARGWVRTDGLPFADAQADLFAGKLFYPPQRDEYGKVASLADDVITGTKADGTAAVGDCSAWTTAQPSSTYTAGTPASNGRKWTGVITRGCNSYGRLYCFGIDRSAPLEFQPAVGRRAFLLKQFTVTAGGGLQSADAACQKAATAQAWPGNYRALLASSTASAASRFSSGGATWVRADGVKLADSSVDFLAGRFVAGLNVTESGEHFSPAGYGAYVWSGSADLTKPGDPTCADWTGAGETRAGEAGFSDSRFFSVASYLCNYVAALYCLQE